MNMMFLKCNFSDIFKFDQNLLTRFILLLLTKNCLFREIYHFRRNVCSWMGLPSIYPGDQNNILSELLQVWNSNFAKNGRLNLEEPNEIHAMIVLMMKHDV